MKIEINAQQFAAVSLFRAVKDVRDYILGVHLETGPDGARLVASDGHQLAVARIPGKFPVSSITIPEHIVAAIKVKARGPELVEISYDEVASKTDSRIVTAVFGDQTIVGKEVDGKFPDFRGVIPEKTNDVPAQYDAELTIRLSKAAKIFGQKFFPGISYNGTGAGLTAIHDDLIVVTMPLRAEQPNVAPAWAKAEVQQQLKEAA